MLLGRIVQPGEPEFLPEDTAALLALAEEERETCPACGLPMAWCRGSGSQFTDYEVKQETCQATKRLADFQEGPEWDKKHASTKRATQLSVRFRKGHEPDVDAGLDLDRGGEVLGG